MSLLFNQAWDIVRGKEDEYAEFISSTFIPSCNKLGLRSVGGYYVEVGAGPRVISVKSVETLEELSHIMGGTDFKELVRELKDYIKNYQSRILKPTGRTKDGLYAIQKGVWKFNQYYDVLPGKWKQYAEFIVNKYLPRIESIDYVELTGGWNVVIGGFSEIIGELTFKDPIDIGRFLNDEGYRELSSVLLRDYVRNYSARILRTTERFDEPRWFRL